MSAETLTWLNKNTLIGQTNRRGNAWHYRASEQDGQTNHYPEAIPVEDVNKRLFGWKLLSRPLFVSLEGVDGANDPLPMVDDRQAIVASDTGEVLGLFKSSYRPHQYSEWLIDNVANIVDDELAISSAGLLRNRAVAWVEVSVSENIKTPEGVEFRPNLLASTSCDGSLATSYKRTVQLVVCDNTMAVAMREKGQTFKIKHSKNSHLRIADAREALEIVYETADEFSAEIARLTSWKVSDSQWEQITAKLVPTAGESKRAVTVATERRDQLDQMYRFDSRVAPWKGTAFGVMQAFNTWNHHSMPARESTVRAERNMLDALNGKTESRDFAVLKMVEAVS